ncbi:helix-turn-helix domain-containing protein [Hylemonella gracilis]|uniref:helix-turn-helix domain-containing protein n=1 Tax=Hylemonella gracilis TaxID=80880 RepID=UPI001F60C3E3|nr:LysR family transcriptional regulator [Hylemonella gracilis]
MKSLPIPNDEVSLQQFRALVAIAQTGSFTLAADALGLTQPAVSHLVKRMEREWGSLWWCGAGVSDSPMRASCWRIPRSARCG